MVATAMNLQNILNELNEKQVNALYQIALCFIEQNNFDYLSDEESLAINASFEEIRRGEGFSFDNANDMIAHFNTNANCEVNHS